MSGKVLIELLALSLWLLISTVRERNSAHFSDEETEAPSSEVTSPQPLSWITLAAVSTRDRGRQGQKRGDTEKATALV